MKSRMIVDDQDSGIFLEDNFDDPESDFDSDLSDFSDEDEESEEDEDSGNSDEESDEDFSDVESDVDESDSEDSDEDDEESDSDSEIVVEEADFVDVIKAAKSWRESKANYKKQLSIVNCFKSQSSSAVDGADGVVFIDTLCKLTFVEYDLMLKVEALKKKLARDVSLEKKLSRDISGGSEDVDDIEIDILDTDIYRAIQSLISLHNIRTENFDNLPLVPLYPHFRLGREFDFSDKEYNKIQEAILTSVIVQKQEYIASRFHQLLFDAGVPQEQRYFLRQHNFDPPCLHQCVRTDLAMGGRLRTVHPVVQTWCDPNGKVRFVARTSMSFSDLCKWKVTCDREIQQLTIEDVHADSHLKIDWNHVSNILDSSDLSCQIDPTEIKLLWNTILNPKNNEFVWNEESENKLMRIVSEVGNRNWTKIAKRFGSGISEFTCFVRYVKLCQTVEELEEEDSLDEGSEIYTDNVDINEEVCDSNNIWDTKFPGKGDDASLNFPWMKEPMDPFTPLEDAALLVVLEQFSYSFDSPDVPLEECVLMSEILYWRSKFAWAQRALVLFDQHEIHWTVEDDMKLLFLGKLMSPHWAEITQYFDGGHSRIRTPNCLRIHFQKLTSALETVPYCEYRCEYDCLKKHNEKYLHLRRAYFELKKLSEEGDIPLRKYKNDDLFTFDRPGFPMTHPPNNGDLAQALTAKSQRQWVSSAIKRLVRFFQNYYDVDMSSSKFKPKQSHFDRRIFRRHDAKSVASALHIRGVKLRSIDEIENPTTFEVLVDYHFNKLRDEIKQNVCRMFLPETPILKSHPELQRILKIPNDPQQKAATRKNLKRKLAEVAMEDNNRNVVECESSHEDIEANQLGVSELTISNGKTGDQCCVVESCGTENSTGSSNSPAVIEPVIKLRKTRGRQVSRLSEIRRQSAQRRWMATKSKVIEEDPLKPATTVSILTPPPTPPEVQVMRGPNLSSRYPRGKKTIFERSLHPETSRPANEIEEAFKVDFLSKERIETTKPETAVEPSTSETISSGVSSPPDVVKQALSISQYPKSNSYRYRTLKEIKCNVFLSSSPPQEKRPRRSVKQPERFINMNYG